MLQHIKPTTSTFILMKGGFLNVATLVFSRKMKRNSVGTTECCDSHSDSDKIKPMLPCNSPHQHPIKRN